MTINRIDRIELLAPAGNMECLAAAVLNGADAVYFGGSLFNARRGAANFAGDELKRAVEYCRLHGVKTDITLNTLLFDRELDAAVDFAKELYGLGVTAAIVQDIGLAALLRREVPGLTLHASTQMGIHDIGGLKYCMENGFSRAVLSREVSLAEIARMHEACDIELEFFCHGALCMGFSGSCLYSSMAGERSGNRGTCAQPCRKNASVLSEKRAGADEYCLSTNDICMIDELAALRDAGVCCLKIEGRMKQPEYVAAVTRNYRAALDALYAGDGSFDKTAAKRELFEIFNRGDFSTSHLYGDSVLTGRTGHAQPSKELIASAHESVRCEKPLYPVSAELDIYVGSPARLTLEMKVPPYYKASAEGQTAEQPRRPIDRERYEEQAKKLGGTVFFADNCDISGEGFIPVSALNAMRREAADKLAEALMLPQNGEAPAPDAPWLDAALEMAKRMPVPDKPMRYVRVRTAADAEKAALEGAELVGIDPALPEEFDTAGLACVKAKRILILPNVLITEGARLAYRRLLSSGAFDGAEINNIGQLDLVKDIKGIDTIIAGIGVNIMNRVSALRVLSLGAKYFMPSPELTGRQLRDLAEDIGGSIIVNTFGRTPLMQLLHCPVKEYKGCRACRGDAGTLTDGEGRRFPLVNTRFKSEGYCLVRMLNCAVTDIEKQFEESGIRAAAAAETPEASPSPEFTRGHWNRAVD